MPFTRHAHVRAGALDVHVAEAGAGREILLLHGNPDTHAVWAGAVDHLADRYRCIAPDLPGWGETPVGSSGLALADQSRFVGDLLDGLDLPRVDLVVHDVGGPFGLSFATEHPERIRSLTIFNTIYSREYRWHFWGRVWRTRGLGELAMAITNRPLFVRELKRGSPGMTRAHADVAYRHFTPATRKQVLRWYRAMSPEVLIGWDERFLAATASTPKAVAWGDQDPFIAARFAETFGAPPEHVHHHPDCGHWLMVEAPDRAAAAIAARVGSA